MNATFLTQSRRGAKCAELFWAAQARGLGWQPQLHHSPRTLRLCVSALSLFVVFTALAAPLQWTCDWPEAKSQTFSLYQGETATFEPTFRVNGRTLTNATIEAVWYQTNGMGNAWWKLDGATFAPSNDVGAASYRFFVEASVPGSPFPVPQTIYRANGALRMLPSPGFTPNAIEPPIVTLDFANIEVAHAPYYDKAETEAKIVELAPAPGDYAAVSNAAMNAVQSESDPRFSEWADEHLVNGGAMVDWASDAMYAQYLGDAASPVKYSASDIASATNDLWQATTGQDAAIAEKQDKLPYPTNSIPYAAISGKPTNVSAFNNDAGYLTGYTESDPTISAWAKAETKPAYTASEVGATTAADVYRLVAGTNVVLVVTNYNSATHAAAMKLQHLDPESGQYVTYWDEMRQHGITYTNGMNYTDAAIAERAAPRAWSGTTSGLGSEAPAGVTWISTPETVIAGGFEYEKVVTSAGAVWVLTSNGMSTGATSNSFFRVAASDGTELFSIEKTDSYLIGVNADGITRSGNTVTIPINVVAAEHPYIRCTKNLVNPTWVKEDEGGLDCAWATVSWSGTTGAYVATVTTTEPQAFFYFEFMQQGTVKIKNSAKTEMSGGILFNGTTYLPTVNGNKLEFVAQ